MPDSKPYSSQEIKKIDSLKERPTDLPSKKIGEYWDEKIRNESLFSARTTELSYLENIKGVLVEVASGTLTPQVVETRLQDCLKRIGYDPRKGFPGNETIPPATPGSITDLSSSRRIQLILDTNVKKARSLGQMAAGEDPVFLAANPAWRLTRTGARKKPRGDWRERWQMAGASVAWKGAAKRDMVALKDSPIWEALGNGVGGYEDTVGSPYPPFAFGSGLAWVNVGRAEWERICKAEGMKVEEPKSPVHSSVGKVQQTDGDDTNGVPKQDLPDYAKSDEFQKRLREALAQIKESEAKKENDPESIVSTDRPLPPPYENRDAQRMFAAREKVQKALKVVKTRLSFLENIQLKYYEKSLAKLTDLSKNENGNLISAIVDEMKAVTTGLRHSLVYVSRDRNALVTYLDRLNGELQPKPQMVDLYASSADRKARRAEELYKTESSRDISALLKRATEILSSNDEKRKAAYEIARKKWDAAMRFDADGWRDILNIYRDAGGDENDKFFIDCKKILSDAISLYDKAFDIPITNKDSTLEEIDGWNETLDRFDEVTDSMETAFEILTKKIKEIEESNSEEDEDWSVSVPSAKIEIKPKTEEEKVVVKKVVDSLPEKIRPYHEKSYDEADQNVVKTIADSSVVVIADQSPRKAYCAYNGVVHLARKTGEWGNTPDTLHHETGHSILDKAGQRSTSMIKDEFKPIWDSVKEEAEEFCKKVYGENWDKLTKRRAQSDWYAEIASRVFGMDKKIYNSQSVEMRSSISDVCDMLCAAFEGRRFWGHSVQYFGSGPARGLHEVVANSTAILCSKFLREKGQTIFPKTLALVDEILYHKKSTAQQENTK